MDLERSIEITNKYGLHARASTRLAQTAQKFRSRIWVARESLNGDGTATRSQEVDAKSVLGILSLGAEVGDRVCFRVSGADAEKAMGELMKLVEAKFHED